jgi:hypothetical protein
MLANHGQQPLEPAEFGIGVDRRAGRRVAREFGDGLEVGVSDTGGWIGDQGPELYRRQGIGLAFETQ